VFDPIPSFLLLHFALLVTAANDPLPKYIDVPVVCSTILVAYFCPKYWCTCKKKLPKTWLAAKQILSQFQPNHNKLDKNKHGHDLMSGTHKVSEHHLHQELQ
jgi:hypothetical protein